MIKNKIICRTERSNPRDALISVESDNPMAVEYFGANSEGMYLRLGQDRGITVEVKIDTQDIAKAMAAFAAINPTKAEAIAYIILGEVGQMNMKDHL